MKHEAITPEEEDMYKGYVLVFLGKEYAKHGWVQQYHIGALRNFLTKRSIKIFKRSNLEEKEYEIGDFKFKCIHTPGHSKDSVTFYFEEEKMMFIGDFVFKESIGRVDLPGGNAQEMDASIKKILEYDDSITLYPGHNEETTLGYEKQNNPYLDVNPN